MKIKNQLLIYFILVLILIAGCSENNNNIVEPPDDGNLIKNNSFEFNNNPSLNYWFNKSADTSYVGFSKDVPTDGGNYSVRLKNEWSFPGILVYFVMPPAGTHRYRLSISGKAIPNNPGSIAGGSVALFQMSSGNASPEGFIHFTDTTWTRDSIIDTLTTTGLDTLLIHLQGNIDQWSNGNVLFDLCTFEKLD